MCGATLLLLCRALEDQYLWETRGRQAKELMSEILKSRLEAQALAAQHGIKPVNKVRDKAGQSGQARLCTAFIAWDVCFIP